MEIPAGHHFSIIIGESAAGRDFTHRELAERQIVIVGNPDVRDEAYETFTVEDAENFIASVVERPIQGSEKFFIVDAKALNHIAANTILKIVEEPPIGTYIYFILPPSVVLPETLLSRARVEYLDDSPVSREAKSFISMSPAERLTHITKLIKSHKDEDEDSGLLRDHASSLLRDLSISLTGNNLSKISTDTQKILSELDTLRGYLSLPGSPVKMILEQTALILR